MNMIQCLPGNPIKVRSPILEDQITYLAFHKIQIVVAMIEALSKEKSDLCAFSQNPAVMQVVWPVISAIKFQTI